MSGPGSRAALYAGIFEHCRIIADHVEAVVRIERLTDPDLDRIVFPGLCIRNGSFIPGRTLHLGSTDCSVYRACICRIIGLGLFFVSRSFILCSAGFSGLYRRYVLF